MDQKQIDHLSQRIDNLEDKLNPNSENYVLAPILPYLQGAAGLGLLWKFLVAVGSLVVIYIQVKGYLAGSGSVVK